LILKLILEGLLREEKVCFIQIEGLLQDAFKDIREAKAVIKIGERSPFLLAYQCMLKAGRALLFLYGLRPANGAQHRTVVQVCEAILGKPFKSLAEQFETMRRKRNELTYEYGALLSHSEVEVALHDAEEWIQAIFRKVKEKNPQFELEF
jgi:uncharacterized protein (UPF0332 family)